MGVPKMRRCYSGKLPESDLSAGVSPRFTPTPSFEKELERLVTKYILKRERLINEIRDRYHPQIEEVK
jgi:hypothetical protein